MKPLLTTQFVFLTGVYVIVFMLIMLWQTLPDTGETHITPTQQPRSIQLKRADNPAISADNLDKKPQQKSAAVSSLESSQTDIAIIPTQQSTLSKGATEDLIVNDTITADSLPAAEANSGNKPQSVGRTSAMSINARVRAASEPQATTNNTDNAKASEQYNVKTNTDAATFTEDVDNASGAEASSSEAIESDAAATARLASNTDDDELPPQWEIYEQRRQRVCQTVVENLLRQDKDFHQLTRREQLVMRDTYKCFN